MWIRSGPPNRRLKLEALLVREAYVLYGSRGPPQLNRDSLGGCGLTFDETRAGDRHWWKRKDHPRQATGPSDGASAHPPRPPLLAPWVAGDAERRMARDRWAPYSW